MRKISFLLLPILILISGPVRAASNGNPILRYFSRLLDESRAEMAVGKLLQETFVKELHESVKCELDQKMSARLRKIAENSNRPDIQYNVYLINSDIADEIVFPGGNVFLTTGLLNSAENDIQQDFILSRNLMHLVLRHPMKLLKKEGLYARLLNQLKLVPEQRDVAGLKEMTRDYLRNQAKMDHKKADLQGLLLLKSPELVRKAAIALLKKFTGRIWPVLPMDTGDLPGRIDALEKLKLPE